MSANGVVAAKHAWVEAFIDNGEWPTFACVEWPFSSDKTKRAPQWVLHRVLTRVHGAAPFSRAHKLHNCDNGFCINPLHLRWGSHQENMLDKVEKSLYGLRKWQVDLVRAAYAEGFDIEDIASYFRVNEDVIWAALRNVTLMPKKQTA